MNPPQKPANPAEAYESFYVPAIFRPLSELVLAKAALRPGEHVLDLACGTGILARQAAPAVGPEGRVAALDLRPGMLAVAQSVAGGAKVEWHEGDAQSPPFEDGSFDVVLCQQGLQFFPDREKALREMKRVLEPGGRVVLACWREFERQTFMKTLGEVELAHLGSLLSRDDALAPFSLSSESELARLCTAAGFGDLEITAATVETSYPAEDFIYNMELAYAAVMPQFVENPAHFTAYVEAVEKETESLRAQHTKDGKISFPMETHIATARA